MRNSFRSSIVALAALLAVSSVAVAQVEQRTQTSYQRLENKRPGRTRPASRSQRILDRAYGSETR